MKPFLHGKKNLSVEPLRLPPGLGAPSGLSLSHEANGAGGKLHGPTVEVVKEGDKVVRLIVKCVCGERVEVECLYPAGN